jgi:hypothetical protein
MLLAVTSLMRNDAGKFSQMQLLRHVIKTWTPLGKVSRWEVERMTTQKRKDERSGGGDR